MTIAELVKILQEYPQDMTVYRLSNGVAKKLIYDDVGYASIREANDAIEASMMRDFRGFGIVLKK